MAGIQYKLLLLAISLIAIVAACTPSRTVPEGNGTIYGKIDIGPLCPVERNPPDPRCQPTAETFRAWPIGVYDKATGQKVATLAPDASGNYSLGLPPGEYTLDLENRNALARGGFPISAIVRRDERTNVDINIDTGIR